MSENEKDNNKFEFIKEQVIEKKHKKIKKWLLPPIITIGTAILFGLVATGTFIIAEPKLNKILNKEEDTKTPVCFPTIIPVYPDVEEVLQNPDVKPMITITPIPEPLILEQSIEADIEDYMSMSDDINQLAYSVNQSVLNVTSTFDVEDWFGKTVEKTVDTTGVIIYNNTEELLVLVSLDRVQDAKNIKIVFADSISVDAVLQDYESEINIALIAVKIEDIPETYMKGLQTATLGESNTLPVGEPIIALGSPNGHSKSMEFGIITSVGSDISISDNCLDLFNTSIEDNENSDGFIINLEGQVVGIITRTLKENLNENLNTVIGISRLKPIITAMGNQDPRIYYGVKTQDLTEAAKTQYNISNGVYVNDVQADSPAFEAGMQIGDIILKIDDKAIINSSDFFDTISKYKPEDKITVKILRLNGTEEQKLNLSIALGKKINE